MVKAPGRMDPRLPFQAQEGRRRHLTPPAPSFASDPLMAGFYEVIWFFGSYQVFHAVAAGPIFG